MTASSRPSHRMILALFDDENRAKRAVRQLIEQNFPMDMISLLAKAQSSGDDPLGLYYASAEERVKGWGKMGAFWGGLWGLFTGAAGLFLIPGLGPLFAAGPVVEALVGAAAGAGVGAGVMAGAAALSHLVVVMRRIGIPEDQLEAVHEAIKNGAYVLLLRVDAEEVARWQTFLNSRGAGRLLVFPFRSLLKRRWCLGRPRGIRPVPSLMTENTRARSRCWSHESGKPVTAICLKWALSRW